MSRRYTQSAEKTAWGPSCSNCGRDVYGHGDSPCRCCLVEDREGYLDCPPDCPDENR